MTQSPGRDSPGSSGSGSGSRHSTASLDSGRASGYHLGPRGPGALASSPRCSISSLGSHPDRPADLDVVHAWLTELQFEEYFPLFASAGYDLATITRMTPEDLTAIGREMLDRKPVASSTVSNGIFSINGTTAILKNNRFKRYCFSVLLFKKSFRFDCDSFRTVNHISIVTIPDGKRSLFIGVDVCVRTRLKLQLYLRSTSEVVIHATLFRKEGTNSDK